MKKQFTSLFILVIIFCRITVAQNNSTYEDVVYLKSGGITRGMILELIPEQSVKIQTADRNVFVYQMTEVLKIVKEEVPAANNSTSGTQSQAVTETDNRPELAKNFISSKINSESAGLLKLKGFTKTNGIEQNLGQKMYVLEFKLTVEFINDGWKGFDLMEGYFGNFYVAKTQPNGYLYGAGYDDFGTSYKLYTKGSLVEVVGEVIMEYTDNGWRATDYDNKGSKSTTTVTTSTTGTSTTTAATTVSIPKEPESKCVDFTIANQAKEVFALNYPGADPIRVALLPLRDNSSGVCGQHKKTINEKMIAILNSQYRLTLGYNGITYPDSTKFELSLESVKFEWKAGISQYDATKAYGGFFCYVVLKSHYYVKGKEIYTNLISLAGGSPSLNDSREAALTKALQTASPYILFELYHCYPMIVKINSINDESNKGVVKEILIEGGEDVGLQEDWELAFYDPATGKSFGKCKIKKLHYQGNFSMCKVTEGDEEISKILKSGTVMYVKTIY